MSICRSPSYHPLPALLPAPSDFVPPVDFLYQTIYHMEKEPEVGFVQGRW